MLLRKLALTLLLSAAIAPALGASCARGDGERIVEAVPGAAAEASGVRVTLNDILDPWTPGVPPPDGKRFVAFEVNIEYTRSGGTHTVVGPNFKLKDADGFAYEINILRPEPPLRPTRLGSGEKTGGWIAFTVNEVASLRVLRYDPARLSTRDIEFRFQ